MELNKRQGIIVWLSSMKHVRMMRRFGNIHYVSRRLKYVALYCDESAVESTMNRLKKYQFVKKVEASYRPFLKTNFDNSVRDAAKEYDYKTGLL